MLYLSPVVQSCAPLWNTLWGLQCYLLQLLGESLLSLMWQKLGGKYWNIEKLPAQSRSLSCSSSGSVSVSSSLNICKDFQVSDTGRQEVSYAIAHICLHTYYLQLDKSSYWQQSTGLSLARGWETDTSKSADFPGLIRIFKGNFPKEKHFNATSLMTHQHVGLCAAYVTFACHNWLTVSIHVSSASSVVNVNVKPYSFSNQTGVYAKKASYQNINAQYFSKSVLQR